MKVITAYLDDGSSHVCACVGDDFDVQTWASEPDRSYAFHLLGVVRLEEATWTDACDEGELG